MVFGSERRGLPGQDHVEGEAGLSSNGIEDGSGEPFIQKDLPESAVEEGPPTKEFARGNIGEADDAIGVNQEQGIAQGIEHGVPVCFERPFRVGVFLADVLHFGPPLFPEPGMAAGLPHQGGGENRTATEKEGHH